MVRANTFNKHLIFHLRFFRFRSINDIVVIYFAVLLLSQVNELCIALVRIMNLGSTSSNLEFFLLRFFYVFSRMFLSSKRNLVRVCVVFFRSTKLNFSSGWHSFECALYFKRANLQYLSIIISGWNGIFS